MLILSDEDGRGFIRARVERAGGDARMLRFVVGELDEDGNRSLVTLDTDIRAMEEAIRGAGDVAFIGVDGLLGYMGRAKTHVNAEVRAVLLPLRAMLERLGIAGISIMHSSKTSGGSIVHAASGSAAFSEVPRVTLHVMAHPDDKGQEDPRRVLATANARYTRKLPALVFRIVGDESSEQPWIEWEPNALVGFDLKRAYQQEREPERAPRDWQVCQAWLRAYLANGPQPASTIFGAADEAGFSRALVKKAKRQSPDIVAEKSGFDEGWVWRRAGA